MKTPTDLYIETSNLNKEELIEKLGKEVNVFHLHRDYNANTRYDRREIEDIFTEWVMKGWCKHYCHADLNMLNFN